MEKKREIKFRFWDKVEKKMIYPANSFPNLDYLHFEDIERRGWGEEEFGSMQFTGLKDKNGKDIFEGDIIKVNGRNMEVFFEDGYFGWGRQHDGKYSFDPLGDEKIEVIGNIYENPELLSKLRQ